MTLQELFPNWEVAFDEWRDITVKKSDGSVLQEHVDQYRIKLNVPGRMPLEAWSEVSREDAIQMLASHVESLFAEIPTGLLAQ